MTVRAVTVDLLAANETSIHAGLRYVGTKTWYSEENGDAGAGELVIPDAATGASSLDTDLLLRFKQGGTTDYTGRIESVTAVRRANDPSSKLVTVRFRDWLAEFDDAVVDPPCGVDSLPAATEVRFDWTHPQLDRTGWVAPTFVGALFTGDLDPFGDPLTDPPLTAKDGAEVEGWPDVFTGWIWSDDVDAFDSHPAETSYFYLPVTATAGPLMTVFTVDDYGQLAIDGALVDAGVEFPAVQWQKAWASGVSAVTAGTHHIAIKATNDGAFGTTNNPGAVAFVAYQQATSTWLEFDNVIARTGNDPAGTDPLTGGDWLCLDAPANPPGFTFGHAFRLLFDAAQDAGCLVGWTLGFGDVNDSNGNAWPVTDTITAKVSDTLLDFLRQSHDRGLCDFGARPGSRVLDAWQWGERGTYWTSPGSPPSWGDHNVAQVTASRRR